MLTKRRRHSFRSKAKISFRIFLYNFIYSYFHFILTWVYLCIFCIYFSLHSNTNNVLCRYWTLLHIRFHRICCIRHTYSVCSSVCSNPLTSLFYTRKNLNCLPSLPYVRVRLLSMSLNAVKLRLSIRIFIRLSIYLF